MDPTEFAWRTLESISSKRPKEIKLLMDPSVVWPKLERDDVGYVIRLDCPKISSPNRLTLHGMYFDNTDEGRLDLWKMFRASVMHLSLHSSISDFGVYSVLPANYSPQNLIFAISLVEDYSVRALARALWPGLLRDFAFANQFSFLHFRPPTPTTAPSRSKKALNTAALGNRIAISLLSHSALGKPILSIDSRTDAKIKAFHESLKGLELQLAAAFEGVYDDRSSAEPRSSILAEEKVELVRRILEFLADSSVNLPFAYSLPYTDTYGPCDVSFSPMPQAGDKGKQQQLLTDAQRELGLSTEEDKDSEDLIKIESLTVLSHWEDINSFKDVVADQLKREMSHLRAPSHIEEIQFPQEDYAEYARARSRLSRPINTLLDQLNLVNFGLDQAANKESGELDLPLATQVVASRRKTRDIFLREDFLRKNEAWAILVDSSKSFESGRNDARDVMVCLAEVANRMIKGYSSWACYAFNENLYVVKDFAESYTMAVKGRIGALPMGLKTLLPDALRVVANRLAQAPEEVKILMVISDGYPLGYDGIEEELKKATQEIASMGIFQTGIGMRSSGIKKYFRSSCVVNGPYDLMKEFVRSYVELSTIIL